LGKATLSLLGVLTKMTEPIRTAEHGRLGRGTLRIHRTHIWQKLLHPYGVIHSAGYRSDRPHLDWPPNLGGPRLYQISVDSSIPGAP
jgi:hypothetical protein